MNAIFHIGHGWVLAVFLFSATLVLSSAIHTVIFRLIRGKQPESWAWGLHMQKHLGKPSRAVFYLVCLIIALHWIPQIPEHIASALRQVAIWALVLSMGWFAIGCVYMLEVWLLNRFDTSVENNLRARRARTQMQVFRRILIGFVIVLTVGALLWSFHDERIWKFGSGLVASAGLASLVLAAAAKSTASNLLAGMQIAFTEPIRVDDVVIVEGEWGTIEEINATYVIVKIWDLRRLIVPLSYFIEQPFQNWTRSNADIMGTAFLYLDYSVPVEPIRAELDRVVKGSSLWDGKVCGLQVTNLSEKTMELRCLMSSKNSSQNFDLRCVVREKMIEFLRINYPQSLPTFRVDIQQSGVGGNAEQQRAIA